MALIRSAQAHRSAAQTAVRAGRLDAAERHLAAAEADFRSAREMEEPEQG